MEASKSNDNVYSISVMVEVIASNASEAVDFVDSYLITDKVASEPRFVSFSVTSKSNEYSTVR